MILGPKNYPCVVRWSCIYCTYYMDVRLTGPAECWPHRADCPECKTPYSVCVERDLKEQVAYGA